MKNFLTYAGAFSLALVTSATLAGNGGNKSDICHFDKEAALFHVINVSNNSVAQHFSRHGDVYPGTYFADTDGDGYGEAAAATDACPNPGFADNADDVFPDDPNEYADTDADGVGDNSDLCPTTPGDGADGCPTATLGSDLLVGNNIYWSHSNSVTALYNDGYGNFPGGQNFNTRLGLSALRVADFNEDGQDDFVAAHYDTTEVSIGLGNGAGGFSVAWTTGVSAGNAAKIAIADVNNDSHDDVAIIRNSGYLTIAVGDGNGNLTAMPELQTGGSSRSLAVGDVDGDGNVDFANIAHAGWHTLALSLGDGAGGRLSFAGIESGGVYLGVVMGDVDGDGDLDLVTGSQGLGIYVFLNDGTGAFAPKQVYQPGPQTYARLLEDFDGDGALDLVTSGYLDNGSGPAWTVQVYYNDGSGQFNTQPASFAMAGGEIGDAAIGDLNEDGIKDIAATNYTGNSVDIIPGDGAGSFGVPYRVLSPLMLRTVGVAVGNFD